MGLKTLDALHLAFASTSKIDYFCTCDDIFLKKAKTYNQVNTRVVSPHRISDGFGNMNTQARPVSEINRQATHILYKEMGVVDTIRFLNQFSVGEGDYTKERDTWLNDISMNDAITQIKARKNNFSLSE